MLGEQRLHMLQCQLKLTLLDIVHCSILSITVYIIRCNWGCEFRMAKLSESMADRPHEIPRYDNIRNLFYHLAHVLDQRGVRRAA